MADKRTCVLKAEWYTSRNHQISWTLAWFSMARPNLRSGHARLSRPVSWKKDYLMLDDCSISFCTLDHHCHIMVTKDLKLPNQ